MSEISSLFGIGELSGLRFGTEMELESISNYNSDAIRGLLNITEDHSLRNNGYEFISRPLSLKDSLAFFKSVWESTSFTNAKEACSERGSIHVHVNVSDLSCKEVYTLIRNYALLESCFFKFVAQSRQNNIYCVPLSATNLLSNLAAFSLAHLANEGKWHKYTAFNILPLRAQGSIEFRHLQATDDMFIYSSWLTFIDRWYKTKNVQITSLKQLKEVAASIFEGVSLDTEALAEAFYTISVYESHISLQTLTFRIKESALEVL